MNAPTSFGGMTLQAVGEHAFADPLSNPGGIDLTAHVDFQSLAESAEAMGARVHGPVKQAEFLRRLGIEPRAAALKQNAKRAHIAEIDSALERLTDESAGGMGALFKVMGFSNAKVETLPGFE